MLDTVSNIALATADVADNAVAGIGHNNPPRLIDADFTADAHEFVDGAYAGTKKLKDLVKELRLTYHDADQIEALKAIVTRRWIYRCFFEQTNSAKRSTELTEQCWNMTPKARKIVKERHDALAETDPNICDPTLKHWHNMNNARVFFTRLLEECGLKEPAKKRASKDEATDTAKTLETMASLPTASIELNNDNIIINRVNTPQAYADFMLTLASIGQRFHDKNADCKSEGLSTDLHNTICDLRKACKGYDVRDNDKL